MRGLGALVAVAAFSACQDSFNEPTPYDREQRRPPERVTATTSGGGVSVGPAAEDGAARCASPSLALVDGGALWSCVASACPQEVGACALDCACNDAFAQALECIAGGSGSLGCFAPVLSVSDAPTEGLGQCIIEHQTACAGPADAGADGDAD
jgi:hypothetical protein